MTAALRRRGMLPVWVALCLAFFTLFAAGCRDSEVVATLERVSGAAQRDRRASLGKWENAGQGSTFTMGDGVRTDAASKASLRLFDQSTLALEPKTLVRFLERRSGPKGTKLDVEMGQATLEAANEALEVDMQLGSARIEAHGKIRLVRDGGSTRLEVIIGSARILNGSQTLELHVGDAVDIVPERGLSKVAAPSAGMQANVAAEGVTGGLAAPNSPAAAVQVASADSANAQLMAATEAAALSGAPVRPQGPELVDFVAAPGESFVVHDPKPPTAIGFSPKECPGGSVLTLDPGRAQPKETVGAARVSVEVPAGVHRYALSCLEANAAKGKPIAQGSISVLADAGSRTLAKSAPLTNVDSDGRRYTVLYQTLLPKVSVRWPNPPPATSFTLKVRSASGERSFKSKTASYALAAGALPEGEHVLGFEADGKRSKPTSVVIRFDNAAPTASISSPADGSFSPGSSVLVAGAARPGFSVSAGGRELTQDAQNRFSETVGAPSGQRALVIRFTNASRNVHYYLRRSAR
jgi:hypothetical protein